MCVCVCICVCGYLKKLLEWLTTGITKKPWNIKAGFSFYYVPWAILHKMVLEPLRLPHCFFKSNLSCPPAKKSLPLWDTFHIYVTLCLFLSLSESLLVIRLQSHPPSLKFISELGTHLTVFSPYVGVIFYYIFSL